MIVLIDNYDSFTYNLLDLVEQMDVECKVVRNDQTHLGELITWKPSGLILSPGPGKPAESGFLMDFIRYFHNKIPIFGVCLGQQAIGEFFGAQLVHAMRPMHGKTSTIFFENHPMYADVEAPCSMMRYHSLVLQNLPSDLECTAKTEDEEIMSIAHRELPIWAVQYHPESVLSPSGPQILRNWFAYFSVT